jgi:hypothetical protein
MSIKNWGERIFASACTAKEHLTLYYQIPVNGKVIDFLVKNERVNGKSKGKLVEVTKTPRLKADKRSQVKSMEQDGRPFSVLYGENLSKIQTRNGDPSK